MTPDPIRALARRLAGCALTLFACGDAGGSAGDGGALAGDTACEKWTQLAAAKGCSAPDECLLDPACDPQAQAWLDCVAQDLSQCSCESGDGDLNCEGSFKPSEGPARCLPEFAAFDACQGDDDPAAGVGDACLPEQIPEGGFSGQEAYLERASAECGERPCLVYRVAGDPRPDCVPSPDLPCATPEQVQEHVHCTCRCDSPTGEGECVCPDGFICVPVLEQGAADVVGSYCVANR
jgi:hypothetical protein